MRKNTQNINLSNRLLLLQLITITLSNYLVQFPIRFDFIDTTPAAFTFPIIFVLTDLTVRLYGAHLARKIIFSAMAPALILSYVISMLFSDGVYMGLASLLEFNVFYFRIACASLMAYCTGQLLDIAVFNRLRQSQRWWVPVTCSTVIGSCLDTFVFFGIAFYNSEDAFMAENWLEFGVVDYITKLIISIILFLPFYGMLLKFLKSKYEFKVSI